VRLVRVEAPAELEDELLGELWALGCEGSWSQAVANCERVRLHAYFAADETPSAAELAARLARRRGVTVAAAEPVAPRDWLAEWRDAARPIPVGARFLVDPREPGTVDRPVDAAGRWLLRLPARTAFGVGSHASTALAVELLETLDVAGDRALDVGTGTGILALAALRLGARAAVALDVDPAAALLLPAAQRLNGSRLLAFAGTAGALGPAADGAFDLALVNVVPGEIAADLPRLGELVRAGGRAVFSGILVDESAAAAARIAAAGWRETARRESGEWIALVAERAG
jgi:ribosomal protein L11 methyltransferase